MKPWIYKLGVLCVILLLAVGSCRKAGTRLVKEDLPAHADVMVLLMGSFSERVLQTADLYHAQVAGKVWIVEEGMGASGVLEERGVQIVTNSTQASNALVTLGIPADSITILPGNAISTLMEAKAVRDHLSGGKGIDTLLLVTSSDHTLRARKIFEAAFLPLEHAPALYSSPSAYSRFHPDTWWRNRNDIQEVLMEYLKLVDFYLFERRELKRWER